MLLPDGVTSDWLVRGYRVGQKTGNLSRRARSRQNRFTAAGRAPSGTADAASRPSVRADAAPTDRNKPSPTSEVATTRMSFTLRRAGAHESTRDLGDRSRGRHRWDRMPSTHALAVDFRLEVDPPSESGGSGGLRLTLSNATARVQWRSLGGGQLTAT